MGNIYLPKLCFHCATTLDLNVQLFKYGFTTSERVSRRVTEYTTQLYGLVGHICTNCKFKKRMKGIDSIVLGFLLLIAIPITILYGFSQNENFDLVLFFLSFFYILALFFGIKQIKDGIKTLNCSKDFIIKTTIDMNSIRLTPKYWIIKTIDVPNEKYGQILQEMNPDIKIIVKHSKITPITYSIFKTIKDLFKPKKRHQ